MLSRVRSFIWPSGKPSTEVLSAAQRLINEATLLTVLTEDMRKSREDREDNRDAG